MVNSFQFARTPKIFFKPGQVSALPGIISTFGAKIILVTGEKSFSNSRRSHDLFNSLKSNGTEISQVAISEEPSPEIIDKVVRELSDQSYDAVLAIGGGSVIDAGKAISAMMYKAESIVKYLEGVGSDNHPGTKLPVIAVPTTSGTGSEATKNAVISMTGKGGFKKSLRHDNFVPEIALVDPELTLECPPDITAASGMDCFTQLVEAYLSDIANNYTDALALEGLKAIRSSLRKSVITGDDITARTGMSFAALTSGICLANAGLGVIHGFASSLGGLSKISHGVICGTLMAAANKVNVKVLKKTSGNGHAKRKYVQLGKMFLDQEGHTDDYYIDGFVQYLENLTYDLKLPKLSEYGLDEKDLEPVCRITENKNNPVKLGQEELMEIILSRF